MTERPRFDFWPMMWMGEIGFFAVTMLGRSMGNDACWPVLDQCRESKRVPCVAVRALESTSRVG